MCINIKRIIPTATFLAIALNAKAQTPSLDGVNIAFILLILLLLAIVIAVAMIVNKFLAIATQQQGVDASAYDFSLIPNKSAFFSRGNNPNSVGKNYHPTNKGYDIKLKGKPETQILESKVTRYSLSPYNFRGIAPIPKMMVSVGDTVKAGDPLFYDKKYPSILYCSPVSGEIVDIARGAKRSIANVVILGDKEQASRTYELPNLEEISREELVEFMAQNGLWPLINERPFDIVPDLSTVPRDIYISTFDSGPLSADTSFIVKSDIDAFQKGIEVLSKLAPVNIGIDINDDSFDNIEIAEKHYFDSVHPMGNVGVQIANSKPMSNSDKIWTLTLQDCITIGRLFDKGVYDTSFLLAIGGDELEKTGYIQTHKGANIGELLKDNMPSEGVRIIAGDVLSGQKKTAEDFLNVRTRQLSVVEEGDQYEMFGWLLPLKPRPSVSRTFPNFILPNREYKANTNTRGEKRAFVLSGQYEKYLPMDIYPQSLMKAILAEDYEQMEGLGILELTEEDIALCEFTCVSKTPMQQILREGLDKLQAQL